MKIVAMLGSPWATAAPWPGPSQGLRGTGGRGHRVSLQRYQGCRACKTKCDTCILEDDLAPVLQSVKEADLLVLASPVYFVNLKGQVSCPGLAGKARGILFLIFIFLACLVFSEGAPPRQ